MVKVLRHTFDFLCAKPAVLLVSLTLMLILMLMHSPVKALSQASPGKVGAPVLDSGAAAKMDELLKQARKLDAAGSYTQAEPLYRDAYDLSRKLKGDIDPATGDVLMDLALNLSNQGKYDVADSLFRQAERPIQFSVFEGDRARLAQYLSYHKANQGQFAEALALNQSASDIWKKLMSGGAASGQLAFGDGEEQDYTVETGELAMCLNFQAKMNLRLNDHFKAHALASEALQLLQSKPELPSWWLASQLQTLGEISIAQRRTSAAEAYFTRAYDIRMSVFGAGRSTVQTLAELGRAYQSDQLNTSAIITFRRAFQQAKGLDSQSELFSREQLVAFGTAIADYAKRLDQADEKLGLYAEAFDAFLYNRSSAIDHTLSRMQAKFASTEPELTRLLDEQGQLQRQLGQIKLDGLAELNKAPEERNNPLLLDLQSRKFMIEAQLLSLNTTISQKYPNYSETATAPKLTLLQVRNQLRPEEALLTFMLGRNQSFVQMITREGSRVGRINAGEAEIGQVVKKLRSSLEVQNGTVTEFDLKLSHSLFTLLFGDLGELSTSIKHLVVVPDGALSSLPFGVLVQKEPTSDNYQAASWLASRLAISHVPSMQSFFSLRNSVVFNRPSKTLLAFGDPVLNGPADKKADATSGKTRNLGSIQKAVAQAAQPEECRKDGPMSGATLRAMAPLPETARELKTIASALGKQNATVFLGADATEEVLRKQRLSDYRIVYFATHGLLPEELKCQAEPGLVLTPPKLQTQSRAEDGLLEASEIATFKLNADLVVLSACNTAGSGKLGGESLSGLAESFFFSGARGLVVSHWQVPSAATEQLMTGLFSRLADPQIGSPSPSLQFSQMQLIKNPKTSHPFFWGAFVVVGDGLGALKP